MASDMSSSKVSKAMETHFAEKIQPSKEQNQFRSEFVKDIRTTITSSEATCLAQKNFISSMMKFIEEMNAGLGQISGEDKDCRPVAVTIQGAIEELLSKDLLGHKINNVSVLILTPAPCTPLMKQGNTPGLTKEPFEESRQYTLDQREIILRKLREAGAHITVAYSEKKYAELKGNSANDKSVSIYENEKKIDRTNDCPLKDNPPAELVGALYEFKDFIIVTQGIQAREAQPGNWKIWFAPSDVPSEAVERAKAMKKFVETNK